MNTSTWGDFLRQLAGATDITECFALGCVHLAQSLKPGGAVFFQYDSGDQSLRVVARYPQDFFGGAQPKTFVPLQAHDTPDRIAQVLRGLVADENFLQFLKEAAQMNPMPLLPGGQWQVEPVMVHERVQGLYVSYVKDERGVAQDVLAAHAFAVSLAAEKMEWRQRCEAITVHDPLTRLLHPRYFRERLSQEIALAKRLEHPLTLLHLRVEKTVAPEVLVKISELVREQFRSTDLLCRWAVGEFVLALSHTAFPNGLEKAEKIRAIVEGIPFGVDESDEITVSVGVAEYPSHAGNLEELLESAHEAVATNPSKNRVYAARPQPGYLAPFCASSVPSVPREKN